MQIIDFDVIDTLSNELDSGSGECGAGIDVGGYRILKSNVRKIQIHPNRTCNLIPDDEILFF